MASGPLLLIILDGYAHNPRPIGNAVFHAKKPTMDRLYASCPQTTLQTFGPRVGLPEGQMGNSEVGHLNIGGGRIVRQELTRINEAIAKDELRLNTSLVTAVKRSLNVPDAALHLLGLLSSGGVHSWVEHLRALVDAALKNDAKRIYVHAITDGRDQAPDAAVAEFEKFEEFLSEKRRAFPEAEIAVASVIGRYFAMDRDKRWERTKKAYDLFTIGTGETFSEAALALKKRLAAGETDEFHEPLFVNHKNFSRKPVIQSGDSVIFFNFRADRMRQLVAAFSPLPFSGFERLALNELALTTLTEYDDSLPVNLMFEPMSVKNHLGEVIAAHKLPQVRIAETEKYAHVTYFFNGGLEEPLPLEERILIASPRDVKTYDLKPEMSAPAVTDAVVRKIKENKTDFYVINFANCDMVGHTGVYEAAIKAVETVDSCLGRILEALEEVKGQAIITADHGNADQMIDYSTGGPHTFHTLHPVPFIIYGGENKNLKLREGGALCDIAPTICELLGIKQPAEMTGRSLISK